MATFGLIGKKLGHSFSRKFFAEKFENENLTEHQYLNFELENITDIQQLWLNNPDLKGLNVTIPYKTDVIALLDRIDLGAQAVGAVNTIKIIRKGNSITTIGYNTDVVGFKNSLSPLLKPHHQKALILGTGGASKAVATVLSDMGIGYKYVSRKPKPGQLCYEDMCLNVLEHYKLIVNSTPLGMYPNTEEAPDIPYDLITGDHLLFDLIYNPEETLFLTKGKEQGAVIKNGMDMLIGQAEAAWEIWNS